VEIINIKDFSYYYPFTSQLALENINLSISQGEFILLTGRSGCGKTTLLRAMTRLIPDFHGGRIYGDLYFKGINLRQWNSKELYTHIGISFQEPDNQIIYNNVEREIAFGLENLGMEQSLMRRRICEALDFFSIRELKTRKISDLSGGEKQKVALAGIMATGAQVLLLDEPASQLDPIQTYELMNLLQLLNNELGITIVMSEQKLDNCFYLADRVLTMDKGAIIYDGLPDGQVKWANEHHFPLVPILSDLFNNVTAQPPLTINKGRQELSRLSIDAGERFCSNQANLKEQRTGITLLKVKCVSYKYDHNEHYAVKDINLNIYPGEFVALVGPNGAGKTTLLKLLTGILKPDKGTVEMSRPEDVITGDRLGYLPQDLEVFFLTGSVLEEVVLGMDTSNPVNQQQIAQECMDKLGINHLANNDPRKLSRGEQQKVALASLLAARPNMLILDEPTLGLDYEQKQFLGQLLEKISQENRAVLIVSHDMDFICEYAQRVVFMEEGEIIADGDLEEIMVNNIFYTSQVYKLFQGFNDKVINVRQAKKIFKNSLG